jgi:hypothetical protein
VRLVRAANAPRCARREWFSRAAHSFGTSTARPSPHDPRRSNLATAGALAVVYAALFAYDWRVGSKGVWDATISIGLLVAVIAVSRWARLTPWLVALINLPLLVHNAGLIGDSSLYGSHVGPLPYDKLVHLLATAVLGALTARAMFARLALARAGVALFAFSFVMLLGLCVELVEFLGYLYLPQSSGFFNPSAGPTALQGIEIYKDTMGDLLTNSIGAALGVAGYLVRAARPDGRTQA